METIRPLILNTQGCFAQRVGAIDNEGYAVLEVGDHSMTTKSAPLDIQQAIWLRNWLSHFLWFHRYEKTYGGEATAHDPRDHYEP